MARDELHPLTISEVIDAVDFPWSAGARRLRSQLIIEFQMLPLDARQRVLSLVEEKRLQVRITDAARFHQRTNGRGAASATVALHQDDIAKFMDLPNTDEIRACHSAYLKQLSNDVLREVICIVCATEARECLCTATALDNIPNGQLLEPTHPHPAQRLHRGMLLEEAGVVGPSDGGGDSCGWICDACMKLLKAGVRPKLALANNMWIGSVPDELRVLTVPEQMLVALHYPKAFVYKLFTRDGVIRDPDLLQRGMSGNVTVYPIELKDVVGMLEGNLLPRRPELLVSVIAICFVGVGRLPQRWLKGTFRVRRAVVHTALQWLKRNNPLYRDIEISEERLLLLPVDSVPRELLSTVRTERSATTARREREGYVLDSESSESESDDGPVDTQPREGQDEMEIDSLSSSSDMEDERQPQPDAGRGVPDVVNMQSLGVADVEMANMSTYEMMIAALINMQRDDGEDGYFVRHSWQPMSMFGQGLPAEGGVFTDKNPMCCCFPVLFPYGVGGIEAERQTRVAFKEHVQWCLRYHDRRFRVHNSFPFVAFGVFQRREHMRSARIQMKQSTFEREARSLSSITLGDLRAAQEQEASGQQVTDARILLLKRHMSSCSRRVVGSDDMRSSYRNQVWSTSLYFGPPGVWATVNYPDTGDPLVQLYCGEDIDMDRFDAAMGPNAQQRARNVAKDPYAAAKAFYTSLDAIFECLLGVQSTSHRVNVRKGILGELRAYYGVVEAQGRGTLHLHVLIWLANTPNATEYRERLKEDWFREKIKAFISANIRSCMDGMSSIEEIRQIPRQTSLAYTRPPDPMSPTYEDDKRALEKALVRTQQVHTCKRTTCLRPNKRGEWVCKRRAPFELSDEDYILENGKWGSRRVMGYLNSWCPALMPYIRCNHDVKLITNGVETRDSGWYITQYATKKQGRSHNRSAVLARAYAYHERDDLYRNSLRDRHRLLLIRCMSALNREQELSGPQVMSYLMGWGDNYKSHNYTPVKWWTLKQALLRRFPSLKPRQTSQHGRGSGVDGTHVGAEDQAPDQDDDAVLLAIGDGDRLTAKGQVTDYQLRGTQASEFNFFDYHTETYECKPVSSTTETDQGRRARGRPRGTQISYLEGHPRCATTVRQVRSTGHNTLGYIAGPFPPRNDDGDQSDLYYASMLALFKPWRTLDDLKTAEDSWSMAFRQFQTTASHKVLRMMDGIQYYYSSADAAKLSREERLDAARYEKREARRTQAEEEEWRVNDDVDYASDQAEEETSRRDAAEDLHAQVAIQIGEMAKIFRQDLDEWSVNGVAKTACADDYQRVRAWVNAVKNCSVVEGPVDESDGAQAAAFPGVDTIQDALGIPDIQLFPDNSYLGGEEELPSVDPDCLLEDQRRAYDIVEAHVRGSIRGDNIPALFMFISGEGGVGKSKVIQTITDLFNSVACGHWLAKAAFTGVAASLIGGRTLHSLLQLGSDWSKTSTGKRRVLEALWKEKRYLIIDEISMISCAMLSKIEAKMRHVKQTGDSHQDNLPFGGVNVIICGDFHQFPPVIGGASNALYTRFGEGEGPDDLVHGRRLYELFTCVVVLRQQVRVTDQRWLNFLRRARTGSCTADDLHYVRTLTIGDIQCPPTDFSRDPWNSAVLVTPRHAVRMDWNRACGVKHCQMTENVLYVSLANDSIDGRPLTNRERRAVLSKREGDLPLPDAVELAIGMKVMVTYNIATEIDITNGARGTVYDIILEEDTEPDQDNAVALSKPPMCVLVKLDRTRAPQLPGLPSGVIPIVPLEKKFTIPTGGQPSTRQVTRRQLPMTAAFAFTDYRAQGQTIPYVIVDIRRLPRGKRLTPFNAYVALSRSRTAENIRLLGDFEDYLFTTHPNEDLRAEDERIDRLDRQTRTMWEGAQTVVLSGRMQG